MFFFEKLVLWYLPEPGKPAVKMRPFFGLPPTAARSGLYGRRGSGCFCFCLCPQGRHNPSPSSGAAVGRRWFLRRPSKERCEGWKTAFLFSRLCTVPADAPMLLPWECGRRQPYRRVPSAAAFPWPGGYGVSPLGWGVSETRPVAFAGVGSELGKGAAPSPLKLGRLRPRSYERSHRGTP